MKTLVLVIILFAVLGCGNYTELKNAPARRSQTPEVQKTETQLDFATITKEILEPHCTNCHAGQHTTYKNYGIVKISAFQMLERIQSQNPSLRMPKGGEPLTPKLQALFTEWVQAGAPEFQEDSDDNAGTDEPSDPEDPKLISFLEIKNKILTPYNCTKCHSQYKSYLPVQQKIGSISGLINDNKMPFPQRKGDAVEPVPQGLKDLLLEWIVQGAPEFSNSVMASFPTPTYRTQLDFPAGQCDRAQMYSLSQLFWPSGSHLYGNLPRAS